MRWGESPTAARRSGGPVHVGSVLALIGSYLSLSVVTARLAVDPLRGRPLGQAGHHIAWLSAACALPEAVSPAAVHPDQFRPSAIVEVSLAANLVVVLALALAERLGRGRLLARAGLDQVVGVTAAVVMTLATAGAVLIESTDPGGVPLGHVLSLGLLIASVAHLRWSAAPASVERAPNARASLPAALTAGIILAGALLAIAFLLLGWSCAGPSGECPVPLLGAAAAIPELSILWRAVRSGRPDVGCAVVLCAIIFNLSATALVDLANVDRPAYRVGEPVTTVAVAVIGAAVLAALGSRLLSEERAVDGQPHSR